MAVRPAALLLALLVACSGGAAPDADPAAEQTLAAKPRWPAPGSPGFEAYEQEIPGAGVAIALVPVPGGAFRMGSPASEPGRRADEGPQVEVRLEPFWMGKLEITWEQYDAWNTDESIPQSKKPDGMSRPTPAYTDMTFGMGREGRPAICMTHEAAREFCRWLSRKTGRFFRLPTEAEWEYACRAGSTTAYGFGDDPAQLGDHAWFAGNSEDSYHPGGGKRPNAFGLFDMHGNVAELCADEWIADFLDPRWGPSPRQDPCAVPRRTDGKPLRFPHAVRGGSFDDPPELLRSAARRGTDPSWKERDPQIPKSWWYFTDAPFLGFRVVRPLVEPPAGERARFENP